MNFPLLNIFSKKQWVGVFLAGLFAVFPRFIFLSVPFERDEGVYAYIADLILKGRIPYADVFDHKPPGVYYIYAVAINFFGHNVIAPRIMAIFFVYLASILMACIVWRLTSRYAASLFSVVCLGMATVSVAYTGYNSNTEIFTLPFILAGFFAVLDADNNSNKLWFFWGIVCGLGVLVKQPVVVFGFAVILIILLSARRSGYKKTLIISCCFVSGLVLPLILTSIYFAASGNFNKFWFGFWGYNVSYIGAGPPIILSIKIFSYTVLRMAGMDPMIWALGVLGIIIYLTSSSDIKHRSSLLIFLLSSFFAVTLGKVFYSHYFLFVIPFWVVGISLFTAHIIQTSNIRQMTYVVCTLLVFTSLPFVRDAQLSQKQLLEKAYNGSMPFYQSTILGEYLNTKAVAGKKAFIIGSEPQLYYYSGLVSPSSIFYYYPIQLASTNQEIFKGKLYSDLIASPPDYMIFVNNLSSHFIRSPNLDTYYLKLRSLFLDYRLICVSQYDDDFVVNDSVKLWDKSFVMRPGAILVFERAGTSLHNPPLSYFATKKGA